MGNHNSGRKKQEVCQQGHTMEGDNIQIIRRSNGKIERACKTCARIRSREWWRKNRGKR